MLSPELTLEHVDPDVWQAIKGEEQRQEEHIELIASENYASPAVMAAQGSVLTNKYAEGYPGKRYYGGCEYVDVVEQLAIDRVKTAVRRGVRQRPAAFRLAGERRRCIFALLKPGDTILGMSLAPWRPSDPRRAGQLSRQAFQRRLPTGSTPKPKKSITTQVRALAQRAQAQDDRRRRVGLRAA